MQNNKGEKKIEAMKSEYEEITMSKEQVEAMKKKILQAKADKNIKKKKRMIQYTAAAAAAVAIFIALPNSSKSVAYAMSNIPIVGKLVEVVTFRDYKYETERQIADVSVPELLADGTETAADKTEAVDRETKEKLKKTTEEINAEIKQITDEIVAEFEANIDSEGYQDIMVKHEMLNTTEDYFTLKLICYQGAGSGAEWDYFYTIDLKSGERLQLKDLFTEGADYITPISESIKEQMRAQMEADENIYYWLEDEIVDWNFDKITDETSFYLNENGSIVISFNEGDVAPMYMGCVEFVIPDETISSIRK